MREAVDLMDALPVTDSDLARIYHHNAERVFKMERK
jgi:predicted TIM-barrel fold metal-dependent hydrolase